MIDAERKYFKSPRYYLWVNVSKVFHIKYQQSHQLFVQVLNVLVFATNLKKS